MDFELVEKQALSLSTKERARLAQELLASIDNLAPHEVEALWLDEAERRAAEIDNGAAALLSGEEVMEKARTLLK